MMEKLKVLTIAMGSDILTTDAQNHTNTSTDCVLDNMTSRLFRRNQDNDIENDLAVSYEIVDDTTWRFVIKEGVTFHNGDTLTSEDVKFSLKELQGREFKEYVYFKGIKEVNVIDETTFEIVTLNRCQQCLTFWQNQEPTYFRRITSKKTADHF